VTGSGPAPAARVVVLGSINRDHTVTVHQRPEAGETVLAESLHVSSGGKGANQAIAAAVEGAPTFFIGAVGDDPAGQALLDDLVAAGVDTSAVAVIPDTPSGAAFVTVTPDGQNTIIVASSANARLDLKMAARAAVDLLAVPGSVLVLQAELSPAVVDTAAAAAAQIGARVVLNQAPYRPLHEDTLRWCDPLIVNTGEAAGLVGRPIATVADSSSAAAELARRCRSVVLTLGELGAVVTADGQTTHLPALPADVVDTVGAGDAFTGAVAARLAAGVSVLDAARTGVAAAAATVAHRGAQPPGPPANEPLNP